MKKIILVVVLVLLLVGCGAPDSGYTSSVEDVTDSVIVVEEDYTKWDLGWGGSVYRIFDKEFNNICYIMDNDTSDDMICFDLGEK